jgi:hypothetical protein
MSTVTPTISSNFYGFDYYEVAYTCLAVQYPVVNSSTFPNITMTDTKYREIASTIPVRNSPITQTVDELFTTSLSSRDVLTINDPRANNVITDNIGVEFYTTSWENSIDLCNLINDTHTHYINIPGIYSSENQLILAKQTLWDEWWNSLLSMRVDLSDYYLMGSTQPLEETGHVKFDYLKFKRKTNSSGSYHNIKNRHHILKCE